MKFSTNETTKIGLSVALMSILSQIAIPTFLGPPINLGVLGVFLIGSVFKTRVSVMAIIIYILLGIVGAPVFANFSAGFGYVLGHSGGFLLGYLVAVYFISISLLKFENSKNENINGYIRLIIYIISFLLIYAIGSIWISFISKTDFTATFFSITLTFIIPDIIKSSFTTMIVPYIRKYII